VKRHLANEMQNPQECAEFVSVLKREGVKSYLEIGSRFGGSLWQVAQVLPVGSKLVSVDMERRPELDACAADIRAMGHTVNLIMGDSTDAHVVRAVAKEAPFDAVLIDGNHTREYVTKDWENYGSLARIVAFHDIGKPEKVSVAKKPWRADVPALWESLRASHRHIEIKADKGGIGFGMLWRW
jgi:predicted O-methyltransferase YrrM